MMDALDLMLGRRSALAQTLTEPGPDDRLLARILRAATRVPDHGKLAPWRIQILRKPGQARLGALCAELFAAANPGANDKQIAFERQRPQRAPLLLAVTAKLRPGHKIPEHEQLLSGGAVCQSLLLAAEAAGFAGQWLTEWPAYRAEVVRALGHDPAVDRMLGFVYLGSRSEPAAERWRPDLAEVVGEWTGPVETAAMGWTPPAGALNGD
ncbi:MAG: nitroreductase [Alphaproteobacteria bacterium]|jgi:nitroreductase|nr:nitroreductase [Alphaproteobacteria bacterium]